MQHRLRNLFYFNQTASAIPGSIQIGTFEALNAAQDWLKQRGYSYGSQQRGAPTTIKKGDHIIGKWRNLDASDRAVMDGTMEGDFRNGPVTIKLKDGHDH